ncbi:MAG: hypothetical protein Q8R79_05870, partial [Legionellaceae bacterium]|nr:hypothetical protein [Legionellaceae bacterium]
MTTPNQPPGIKNFATSQTPGPFYSFGQFLVNKGQAQLYVYPNITKNENQQYNSVNLYGVYGLTDHASILFNI